LVIGKISFRRRVVPSNEKPRAGYARGSALIEAATKRFTRRSSRTCSSDPRAGSAVGFAAENTGATTGYDGRAVRTEAHKVVFDEGDSNSFGAI